MNDTQNIVVSSRIRLARNVADLPFPAKLGESHAALIVRKVYDAVARKAPFELYRMGAVDTVTASRLCEKHLISRDLLQCEHGAAAIAKDETISLMINEEDHIRQQCILKGLSLEDAYRNINEIDETVAKSLKYAYSPRLGYLTACPTNLGTGMRASAMMFLPGLTLSKSLEKCVGAVARFNMTIRGVYGEGSEAEGYLYQISNQKTLGLSEKEIIDSVQTSVSQIVDAEHHAREMLMRADPDGLKDNIMRAYGILCYAHSLGTQEFMRLMALVKLGAYYELIKLKDGERLEKLITDVQPAGMSLLCGKTVDAGERDKYRAAYVGKLLKELTVK